MTFTYDLSEVDENLLNISRVRLELGDTTQNAGVRPDGSNLQDEEILLWLEEESSDIMQTVARACEALSNMWTTVASLTVGPRSEQLGDIAKRWAERAQQASPAGASYQAKVISVDQVHDPYRVRTENETGI